jgi:hypothetical protein
VTSKLQTQRAGPVVALAIECEQLHTKQYCDLQAKHAELETAYADLLANYIELRKQLTTCGHQKEIGLHGSHVETQGS